MAGTNATLFSVNEYDNATWPLARVERKRVYLTRTSIIHSSAANNTAGPALFVSALPGCARDGVPTAAPAAADPAARSRAARWAGSPRPSNPPTAITPTARTLAAQVEGLKGEATVAVYEETNDLLPDLLVGGQEV